MPRDFVHRVWRAFGLKPHLSRNFKLSNDPHFIDKVPDVVGLYLNPPDKALVLCVEKKPDSGIGPYPTRVTAELWNTRDSAHDYRRYGTTTLFAALEVATGRVVDKLHRRHRSQEFITFLRHIGSQALATVTTG